VLAQLGTPDMRTPIALGLAYPQRIASGAAGFPLMKAGLLEFLEPDLQRFPCLGLAYAALRGRRGATVVLNASNEVAVQAFLERRIGLMDIGAVCAQVLDRLDWPPPETLDELLALDARARDAAAQALSAIA
jgi:1-deoxy-D-xylulose-5-phosphate reductoisomerase